MTQARRFRYAFILQVVLSSLVIVVGAYALTTLVKRKVVDRIMEDEAAYFWTHRELDPSHQPPRSQGMRGYAVDRGGSASTVPEALRVLQPGRHELQAQGLSVLVDDRPQGRVYLAYPRTRIDRMALALVAAPILLALLAVLLSAWLTYRMTRRLLAPMGWLAGEVRHWDPRHPDVSSLAPDRLPPDTDVETRQLAGALHQMSERMRSFVARERDFTRDSSHELRTPLTVIRVASDLLLSDPDMPVRAQRSLTRIQRAGRDMEAVIDAFLILAREADIAPQSEDFEVRDVVHEEVEKARATGNCKRDAVDLAVIEEGNIRLHAPPRVLGVMVGNLLANACAFTDQGRIEIRIGQNRIEIRDTGVGMSAETLEHAFDPFYRVAQDAPGKGMGLSIVRRLSERFGWPVTLESTPGRGTVASIRFA